MLDTFLQIFYFLSIFLCFGLGMLIYFSRPRSKEVAAFAGLILSLIGWLVSLYFFYQVTDGIALVIIGRINFVFPELIVFFALLFVHLFPEPIFKVRRWQVAAYSAFTVLLAAVTFATKLVDADEIVSGISRVTVYGRLYWVFVAHFSLSLLASIVILILKLRKFTGKLRHQLVFVTVGWVGGAVFSAMTNIFIPMLTGEYDVAHYGTIGPIILVFCLAYAVARHQLLDVKTIAAEFFIYALALIFVVNLSVATSPLNQALDAALLTIGSIFGVMLIKSVRQEVEHRQRLHQFAADLEASNAQLREANQMKSEFISIASHQLRTPVSVIKGYLSLMRDGTYGKIGGQLMDKLQQVFDMNERLVHLINNFLNLSRIERGGFEFTCRAVDLGEVIGGVVSEMAGEAKTKGLKLSFRRPPKPVPEVWADVDKVHEVLTNIVDNAIKYTASGSVTADLSVADGEAVVRVTDTGVGMDADDLEHVFEKYFRRHKPDPTSQSGMSMGLGLFICASFIHEMGGKIWVEKTVPNRGTTIAFSLPFEPVGACAAAPPQPDNAKRL
jgi:signal transduction histidine kinase